jgi:hypothetical protein
VTAKMADTRMAPVTEPLSRPQVERLRAWAMLWANDPEFRPDGANEEGAFMQVVALAEDWLAFQDATDEIANRFRACLNLADDADTDGDHIGWARHYRAVATGLGEAHRLIEAHNGFAIARVSGESDG